MWSCDQNWLTLAILGEKLSQPQFYKDLTRKTTYFAGWSWFKFNNLGLALGMALKFYTSMAKGLKGTNFYVCRSYRGKSGRVDLFDPSILNRVKRRGWRTDKRKYRNNTRG